MEWDLREASAVCRQLEYAGAVAAIPWPAFGTGNKMIVTNRIQCVGNESSISDCSFMSWKNSRCHYYRSMSRSPGAVCSPAGNYLRLKLSQLVYLIRICLVSLLKNLL